MSSLSLHPSAQGFRILFDSAPDPYLALSADLRIVAVSDAYLRVTLTDREQLIGKPIFEAFPDDPDDPNASGVSNLRASLLRVLESGTPDAMAVQKYAILRPESEGGGYEERFWSPLNTPVLNEKGEIEYIIHRVEDVTDFVRQHRLTEELRTRTTQMEHDIFLRGQQLQQANERLRRAERVKSEFFANVSHELRTPLSLILAPTESLLSGKYAGLPEAALSLLQTIHNNAIRLLQMVTGLLDFAKAEAGKMTMHPEPTDVNTLVRSVTHEFLPVAEQKKIRLSLQPLEESPTVLLDRYLFERILFNLLSNAIKFTDAGGKVTVRLAIEHKLFRLLVEDTGIGIAKQDLPVLFQQFRQIEGASTRRFEGTGLGLAMVREFSEQMGGSVSVESEPGKGSIFAVQIPAELTHRLAEPYKRPDGLRIAGAPVQGNGAVPAGESGGVSAPGADAGVYAGAAVRSPVASGMRVLVCEDNLELRRYIAALLEELAEVRTVSNGREGLELVHSWAPQLVLSDMMMPELDGLQLCSMIKTDPATAGIVVVLLTAQTHRDAMLKGWEAGADEYLFKPFHPQELLTRIRSLLTIISERRRHTGLMEQRNRELLLAQAERDQKRKLEEYAVALERSNKDLEEFAYICAHDMKSPVSSLRGLLDMMEQKEAVKEQHKRVFDMARRSVEQMQKTITTLNDILAFKKTFTQQSEEVRFDEVLDAVKNILLPAIRESGAGIRADFSRCPTIGFSRVQLQSVIQNLVANSIKYAKEGEAPAIEMATRVEDGYVVLEVRDQGIGMDLDLYGNKLFHLFNRFHTNKEGSGVGLYLVRSIVEYYKGKIVVDSEVDKGTIFKLYFSHADVQ